MGTSGGEPRVLLNALKPMLGVVGDIRTTQEVMRVVGMMKDAEKLMSRCVYLNILKATCRQALQSEEKKETLEKFLVTGGWGILNKWLHEFTKSENYPVLLELIDVLKILPITVELLKQGNTGKLIKQMTKLENGDIKKCAFSLIKQWKDMIRGGSDKKTITNESNKVSADLQDAATNKRLREQIESKGPPEKRTKVKLIEALPKQVLDSSGFMNALNAAVPASIKKKRRNSNSKTNLPLDEILNKPMSDKKQKLEAESERLPVPESPTDTEPPNSDNSFVGISFSPAVEAANLKLAADTDDSVVVDEGSLAKRKKKRKRNIFWAPDDQLVKICYFELCEGEKKGHHAENFSQARQHESLLEKQAMRYARRGEDKMSEKIRWSRLIPVDNAGVPNFLPGEKSREKYNQAEREKGVLAFIFLTKESLPDNPTEPDFDPEEHSNRSQPRVIPHDEEGTLFPAPKTATPSTQQQSTSSSSQKQLTPISEDGFKLSASTTSTNPPAVKSNQTKSNFVPDVSPAVQNIMSQLLRKNDQIPNTSEQTSIASLVSNMASSLLGQSGVRPNNNNKPPPAPGIPPEMMVQGRNQTPPGGPIPSIMQNPIPNPNLRGHGGMGGPRFRGGPPPPGNRGRGGFNHRTGPGPRPRWNGPPPQQGPNRTEEWDGFSEGFNDNFRHGPNHRGNGDFAPPGRNEFNENFNCGGRGFRRGGSNNRGRNSDRGRNRGSDRGRGGEQRHIGVRGIEGPRDQDWGRDEPNFGSGPNRGRGGGPGNSRNRENRDAFCHHFQSSRGCRNGDRCNFMHVSR